MFPASAWDALPGGFLDFFDKTGHSLKGRVPSPVDLNPGFWQTAPQLAFWKLKRRLSVTTAHVHQCCIFQSYAKTVPSRMKLTMREPASMTTDT